MQHCRAGESQGGRCALLFSLVEVKQYFILLKSLCETPRPRIMLSIIKPIFAETEKNITELCLAHVEATALRGAGRCIHTQTLFGWKLPPPLSPTQQPEGVEGTPIPADPSPVPRTALGWLSLCQHVKVSCQRTSRKLNSPRRSLPGVEHWLLYAQGEKGSIYLLK